MREIKFRAWNGFAMLSWDKLIISSNAVCIKISDTECDIDNVSLMQYTGLKDKNGVEIYESDLANTRYGLVQICWDEDFSCYLLDRVECGERLHDGYGFDEISPKDIEVIGNIYKNPELLEMNNE